MTNDSYPRAFFERDPDAVARDLIGADLVIRTQGRAAHARIVETEAYGGSDDPASHAYRGSTTRCAVMFGPAGYLYVYRSYGVHWCMNVVTGRAGTASAVLLRGAEIHRLLDGDVEGDLDEGRRVLRGPGNLTRGLGVTGADNGVDCTESAGRISFREGHVATAADGIARSTRIGISREQERLSRYFLEGHRAVSPPRSGKPRERSRERPRG